jgi:hypothetical protein
MKLHPFAAAGNAFLFRQVSSLRDGRDWALFDSVSMGKIIAQQNCISCLPDSSFRRMLALTVHKRPTSQVEKKYNG